jgi:hypothetical protein
MNNIQNILKNILTKYKPIIYFHEEEKYFPCNADYFVKNSFLIKNNKIIDYNLNQSKLYNIKSDKNTFIQPFNDDIKYGFVYNYQDAPLYYYIREDIDKIYIYFFLFYGYNGSYNILNILNLGEHYNDIEHFTYEINKINGNLERIFFSAHGSNEGIWKDLKQIDYDKETERPIIYVAKYGHGFYPKDGCFFRMFGFANDLTGKGYKYSDYDYIKISKSTDPDFNPEIYGWFYSNIRFGVDGTTQIYKRNFLLNEDQGTRYQKIIQKYIYNIVPSIVYLIFILIIMKSIQIYMKMKSESKKILYITFIYTLFIILLVFLQKTIKNKF